MKSSSSVEEIKKKWNCQNVNEKYTENDPDLQTNSTFRSGLHWLCGSHHVKANLEKMKHILSLGANLNLQTDSRLKSTPLELLCWKQDISKEIEKCIFYLIEKGSNIFITGKRMRDERGIGIYLKKMFPFNFNDSFFKMYLALLKNIDNQQPLTNKNQDFKGDENTNNSDSNTTTTNTTKQTSRLIFNIFDFLTENEIDILKKTKRSKPKKKKKQNKQKKS